MKKLISTTFSIGFTISFYCVSAQSFYSAEYYKFSELNKEVKRYQKHICTDSLTSDSLLIHNADSLSWAYVTSAVRNKVEESVKSGIERMETELSLRAGIPSDIPTSNPFEEFETISQQAGFQGQTAFDHFSGQSEKLNYALSKFDDLKRKGKELRNVTGNRDSAGFTFKKFQFLLNCGGVRPLTAEPAIDLYPTIGVLLFNKLVLNGGKLIRVGQNPGTFRGLRLGAEYYLHKELCVFLEGEILQFINEGVSISNRHMLTGIKKTIPLKGHLSSFVMAGLDWGRQLANDGYAERYRYRAGLEYKIIPK
jgi:hypothetical protein